MKYAKMYLDMNTYDVIESATLTLDVNDATGKRWRARIIKAGWGSKGYYTEEALKNDGPKIFKAGTPIFLDHQTPEERELRPHGSVTTLAGELATDAVWNAEEGALDADVEIFEHQQTLVKSLAKKVGLSIRARTIAERGEREGRTGRIITGLVGARSVDLVVRAGAGGQLLDVLESESEQEMEEQQMDEVLEAINKLSENVDARFAAVDAKFTELEESLSAEVEAVEVETVAEVTTEVKTEEHPDLTQTIAELVAAEVAKIKGEVTQESADAEGNEENVDDVEESASDEVKLPKFWAVKENK